jgi:transcriptional regulator with XRE-family HTH domain
MTTSKLGSMIQTILDEKGWSQRELARRADLPPATVQKIINGPSVTPPRPTTLERLAAGLGVSVRVLSQAAAEDTGYTITAFSDDDHELQMIVASIRELPPQRRQEIAALVESMLNHQR